MNREEINKIKSEIFAKAPAEIIEIADEVLHRVTQYASLLYARVGRKIDFSWRDDPRSTAATYHETSKDDRVVFSYQFALDLYRDACLLSRLARVHFCDSKYTSIFGHLTADRAGVLPAGYSEEQCSKLMFEATLEWVFFHEMAHLSQGHIEIRNSSRPNSHAGIIEELSASTSTPLQGDEALISHVTEIAADHEGLVTWLQYRSVLNANTIPYADVYMAVCGLTCLFNRFFGSSGKVVNAVPEGSHPSSAMRWELLLPTFLGFFLNERVRDRFPTWAYGRAELQKQLTEANALANLQWILCYGPQNIDPLAFITTAKLDNPEVRKYLRKIVSTINKIRPEVEKRYLFPVPPSLPVFTEEWIIRISED
ncbi:hypothetical protein [Burkholderia gladioli]|uniref:hypothetical protein n=1 Tax=Burkholderia gladioli TaxID=28095 RepID=UPI00163F1822|nr:hypothetical protein [Burkholderia gladioli]